jgi:hypothetical protein
MNIENRNASLQARIQKQLEATGSASMKEVLLRQLLISGRRRRG